jgi:hypothetical protein
MQGKNRIRPRNRRARLPINRLRTRVRRISEGRSRLDRQGKFLPCQRPCRETAGKEEPGANFRLRPPPGARPPSRTPPTISAARPPQQLASARPKRCSVCSCGRNSVPLIMSRRIRPDLDDKMARPKPMLPNPPARPRSVDLRYPRPHPQAKCFSVGSARSGPAEIGTGQIPRNQHYCSGPMSSAQNIGPIHQHRRPWTAFGPHNGHSAFALGAALPAPFRSLPRTSVSVSDGW